MSHTIDDFLNKFPEFSSIPNESVIQMFIDEFDETVNFTKCPKLGGLMRGYFVAHNLAKSSSAPQGMDEGVGMVSSSSVGSVSESRTTGNKKTMSYSDNWYGSTHYGAKFLMLRARCFGGAITT